MYTPTEVSHHFKLPGSSIKSPGRILSSLKTEIRTKESSSGSEIETVKNIDLPSSSDNFSDQTLTDGTRTPIQSPSDRYLGCLSILSQYNIQVNNILGPQQANLILSEIIQELNQLPQSFVRKLQLKITLTNHPDVFGEKSFFRGEDILSENKIRDKLYRLLFEQALLSYPTLLILWNEDDDEFDEEERGRRSTQIAKIHKMEDAFYAIMQNRKHPKTKLDVIKLKNILVKIDPSSFSHDWFKERNLQLKKNFHVQFDV